MSKSVKIKGLNNLTKKLRDPDKLASEFIDKKGGVEVECPKCHKKIKVSTKGATCSCGQKLELNLEH